MFLDKSGSNENANAREIPPFNPPQVRMYVVFNQECSVCFKREYGKATEIKRAPKTNKMEKAVSNKRELLSIEIR